MSVNWTPEQLRAIEERGRTVLVSAAAGSGKTAVLVERVIRRITDENDPCNINEFLIVTFTKAAAAEMKSKIADALMKKLLDAPGNRRLRRQLTLLDRAQITTVHSFCANLLRENFQAAGLAPDFRVADEDETAVIKSNVLDELIEAQYEIDDNEGFTMLVEALSAMRDDSRLRSVVLETYDKLQSHPFPELWLRNMRSMVKDEAENDPLSGVYGRELISVINARCRHALDMLRSARELMRGYPAISNSYGAMYDSDIANIEELLSLLKQDWDSAAAFANNLGFTRLNAVRGFDDPVLLDIIKAPREAWRDLLKKMCADYFGFTAAEFRDDMQAVLPYNDALFSIVSEFSKIFEQEKRMRGILDFNDLEHLTVRILLGEDESGTRPTALARSLSYKFTEIMVDEYQDTNEVQDAIFTALSKNETNLFMVGDIKQSIYSFRLANPEVFLKKFLAYANEPAPGEPVRIILAKNFRSRESVTNLVNYVFNNIMSRELGGIEYGNTERLIPAADYPDTPGYDSELCLVETDEESDLSAAGTDAEYAASRIRSMLDDGFLVYDRDSGEQRPCVPEDFAILLRSVKNKAALYESALAARGITSVKDVGSDLFSSGAVITLFSLIDVLDNPEQDICLASLMRSPLYHFTADELARIRIGSKGVSFFTAVLNMNENEDELGMRCRRMTDQLNTLRLAAQDMPADRLIMHIINETRLDTLCGAIDGGEPEKLRSVLDQAERFERAGYRGLYRFASLMRSLRRGGCEVPFTSSSGSAVRIMSIHKSKGLEFPIVILAGCQSRFNMRDLTEPVLIHPKLGAGFRRRHVGRRIEYPTLPRLAIAARARSEALSEEARILYVAMTRAKEKLIVTAAVRSAAASAAKYYPDAHRSPLSPQMLLNCISPFAWIFTPLLRLPGAAWLLSEAGIAENFREYEDCGWQLVRPEIQIMSKTSDVHVPEAESGIHLNYDELYSRLSYVYHFRAAADIPSKLTATSLKGRYTDAEAAEDAPAVPPSSGFVYRRPRFIQDTGLSGAERGVALHLAMQFIDFNKCTDIHNIKNQISELLNRRLLTCEQAEAVDAACILAFFESPLGRRLGASGQVRREFKFSLLSSIKVIENPEALAVPPLPDEDTILFQGVIDCYFEENNNLVLVDFKTDFISPGSESTAALKYKPQLDSYTAALGRITGQQIAGKYIYFFRTNTAVEIL